MAAEHHGVGTPTMPSAEQLPLQQQRSGSSHTTRPKIKIIHIIAPEIIKTDVANFRDLVQRLTGKQQATTTGATTGSTNMSPPPLVEEAYKETIKKRPLPPAAPPLTAAESWSDSLLQLQESSSKKRKTIKCEVKVEEGGLGDYGGFDCHDLWMGLNPGGSFLSFLEEAEPDVFQGLAVDHDFLQLPHLAGEMYAS